MRRVGPWDTYDEHVGHYSHAGLSRYADGMAELRRFFGDGGPNDLNVILFSTSGVHGSYATIEEVEATLRGEAEEDDQVTDVTFVILQPRVVAVKYGNVTPRTLDDIRYLKWLRAKSHAALLTIGAPHYHQAKVEPERPPAPRESDADDIDDRGDP